MKRIGVLTSGGDCAGLNAAIRSIVLHAHHTYGAKVIGVLNGTTGLIRRPLEYIDLHQEMADGLLLRQGGTLLGSTNNADPYHFPCADGSRKDCSHLFIEGYKELDLDAIIGIGGDGSVSILQDLARQGGLNLVCIPKTIDNDLSQTELSIGYSTALDVATEALDRLQSTAASHHRLMILEVMGRDAGHIALGAGIAGGADVILIPEIPYAINDLCDHIQAIHQSGRKNLLMIVAESVKTENGDAIVAHDDGRRIRYGGVGYYLAEQIKDALSIEVRVTVLGHVQRGGMPNVRDRVVASAFGVRAVDLVMEEKFERMVAWQNNDVTDVAIDAAIGTYQAVDVQGILAKTAKKMGVYLGKI